MTDAVADLLPPSLEDFTRIARAAWDGLPQEFRRMAGDIVFQIADFAEPEDLEAVGLDEPFSLSGLYRGVDLTRQSLSDPTPAIPMVFLYRRPILDEWAELGSVSLGDLIAHVLVHEVGHHFGLTDEQMDAILGRED